MFRIVDLGPILAVLIFDVVFRIAVLAGADIGDATVGLNFSLPYGWRIGYQARGSDRTIVEIVPQKENVHEWTRMITIQKFTNPEIYHPEKFINGLAESAKTACQRSSLGTVPNGRLDGFVTSQKVFVCHNNSPTGANEIRNIKAIQGEDFFYVIQIIHRQDMTKAELVAWVEYLRRVTVKRK